MGLVTVNTSNQWLASAANTSFNHGSDMNRYLNFTDSLANGGTPVIDQGIFDVMMTKLSDFFRSFSGDNKKTLLDMMMGAVENVLGIGYNILDRLGITGIVNTICGGFDANTYGRYGNMNGIYSLGLMSMLTALLCMAIKGALGLVAAALGVLGMAVGAIVKVVDTTLDGLGFNPIKPITNGITNFIYGSPTREYTNSKLDISGMVEDIVSDAALTKAFKGTSTAERLLSGYNGKGYEYEDKLNALLPDYSISSLSKSKNAGNMLLNAGKSTAVDGISSVISGVSKKDYLMLL